MTVVDTVDGCSVTSQTRHNAEQLEQALAQTRGALVELSNEEERSRRAEAIDQLAFYATMLRHVAGTAPTFSFKLELDDGRWNVDEKELVSAPRVGDIVSFRDGQSWRIISSELVQPRPSQKPAREFFVCTPAT